MKRVPPELNAIAKTVLSYRPPEKEKATETARETEETGSEPMTENESTTIGALRVWHIPQVPMQPFNVAVATVNEAALVLDVLAMYDDYEFRHDAKPDYCNAAGLNAWDGTEWSEWYSEDGDDIDAWVPINGFLVPTSISRDQFDRLTAMLREYDRFQRQNRVKGLVSMAASFLREKFPVVE